MRQQKLKVSMLLMQALFLVIMIGGSGLIYNMFAPAYYRHQKSKVIEKAYQEVRRMDLANLEEEDLEIFQSYEKENLVFTIADRDMNPVYTTNNGALDKGIKDRNMVHRNIVIKKKFFSKEPEVEFWTARNTEKLCLFGKFSQDNVRYFVSIKENVQKVYSALVYTEKFLLLVVVCSIVAGCIVMYWQSRRIAKPIEELNLVSQKLAGRDFSVRAKEYHTYQEVDSLSQNFNIMADELQYYIEKLESSKNALERFNKMRNDFTATVTHELKTPLAVLSSQIEILQTMGDKIDRDYYYSSILEEIQKMSDMVGNLLNISSVEHELETMDKGRLDLSEVLEYLTLKYDALFHKKNLKVEKNIENGCVIFGNQEYIEQAMSNYIMNAFAHSGDGRYLSISLQIQEEKAIFSVCNDGEQLSEEEKIWDKYYQGEETEGHSGLGLHIVKTIITMHGGEYGAENCEKGVKFWFTLPLITD